MGMVGRQYVGGPYRYGFSSKEIINDLYKEGNAYDFGARILNPRLAKWMSVDPLQSAYPNFSPYCFSANSPLYTTDPDGRLIIFINGLWGPPNNVGKGGTEDYWGKKWVSDAQNSIGDHKTPRFFDGSRGGTRAIPKNLPAKSRIRAGKAVGYKEAKSIIASLDKDETIKIITNSMGAAFERGFTQGLLEYKKDRLDEISGEILSLNLRSSEIEKIIGKDRIEQLNGSPLFVNSAPVTTLEKEYIGIQSQKNILNGEKEKLNNLEIEMVIDLSSHQIDYPDPNATSSYYMTAGSANMTFFEEVLVSEKEIKGATNLGTMSAHHSSGANPAVFPSAKKRN